MHFAGKLIDFSQNRKYKVGKCSDYELTVFCEQKQTYMDTFVNVSFKYYQNFYFAYILFWYWDFLFIEEEKKQINIFKKNI